MLRLTASIFSTVLDASYLHRDTLSDHSRCSKLTDWLGGARTGRHQARRAGSAELPRWP